MRTTQLALVIAIGLGTAGAMAATPESGVLSAANPIVEWDGDNPPPDATASNDCQPADPTGLGPTGFEPEPNCDPFSLLIEDPGFNHQVSIVLTASAADDWDMLVRDADGNEWSSGNNPGEAEVVVLENPTPGEYTVFASPYAPTTAYHAVATLTEVDAVETPAPTGNHRFGEQQFKIYAPPGAGETDPNFSQYAPVTGRSGLGLGAAEPTMGVPHKNNWELRQSEPHKSRVMFIAGLETLRMTVDERTDPAVGHWEDRSSPTHIATLDPILHTDWDTGRTISTQLNAKRSLMSLSDDEGDTWTESPQGAGINAGVDHQTVGSGRYPDGFIGLASSESAFYYASQDAAIAQISRSDDGGLTWGVSYPMYNIGECGGLHGHVQVSPADGSVYVPNGNCPLGQSGYAYSEDAGLTWAVQAVPGIGSGDDPGMAIGADGTIYFGQCSEDKFPVVSVSSDKGETWHGPVEIDPGFGIQQCVFPTMVAGDGDRAAFAFLGSSDPGPGTGTDVQAFQGEYFGYVAITYDRGQTWDVINVTPGDPVQRGPVCLQGTLCPSNRNLLDFNDVQIDEMGRVYFAFADGCVGACATSGAPNSGTEVARLARQMAGSKGLFAEFDDVLAPTGVAPAVPFVRALNFGDSNQVVWTSPYDGGSAIHEYQIFARTANGDFGNTPMAIVDGETLSITDDLGGLGDFCYYVSAINANGASGFNGFEACAEAPTIVDPCSGVVRVSDSAGDQVGGSQLDVLSLTLSEPFFGDPQACAATSEQKIVFELEVGDTRTAVDGNSWIIIWNRQNPVSELGQTSDRNMVNMRMVGASPSCNFGHISAPSVNQGVDLVSLDDCEMDGNTLRMTVPTSVIDDCDGCSVGPGYELSGLEVRAFAANQTGMPVAQTSSQDFGLGLSYQLYGNDFCAVPVSDGFAAIDDNATMPEQFQPITIPVTLNDLWDRCGIVNVISVTDGNDGTVQILPNGQDVRYTPRQPFCEDYFTYTLEASDGATSQAVVVIKRDHPYCN